MESSQIEAIKQKTTKSIFYLSFRNIGVQIITTIGFFLLTILLGTGDVGLFAIVSESIAILGYFSDIGLASALIQQKDDIKKEELQTTFTVQQILVFIGLLTVAILYPLISAQKNYGNKEFSILIALCFSFQVASLKTIPSVLLERKLNFKLLSLVDMVENITFYVVAVVFAFLGFGVYSYAIATFLKSIIGLALIYRFQSWPLGINFSFKTLRPLLRFGIPFQLNSFIALAKDRLSNLLVAGIIGRDSFGLLSWAQKGPRIPLSFMDAIMKVTFPTFSRIQNEFELLKRSLSRSMFFVSALIYPSLAGISIIASDLVSVIPKYNKWQPAILPLYLYAFSFAIAAVTTPITNAFNAVGKIKITTKLMIMWTILTWLFFPILSLRFGYFGTALASVLVGISSFYVWYLAWVHFSVNILKVIIRPLISSLIIIVIGVSINYFISNPAIRIITKIIFSTLAYFSYHIFYSREDISWLFIQIKCLKKNS